MAQIFGTTASLHIPVSLLPSTWDLKQITEALSKFAMKGYSTRTLAHSDFDSEIQSAAYIDYEQRKIVVNMSIENIRALFPQAQSQNDLTVIFTRDFVNHLRSQQLLSTGSAQLSKQAQNLHASSQIKVYIT